MRRAPQHRISVALCTCNGQQFLGQQLASIAQQTRLPEQLVVSDDGSVDQTLSMVRAFAASVSFPVKVIENADALGSTRNFEQAMRHCDGDLIALSDQDDIWYPNRLQRSEEEFIAHPDAGLVFSDADVIDDHDTVLGKTLWQRLGFAGRRRNKLVSRQFVVLAKHRFVTGATVMFRAALRDRFLPMAAGWIHDEWMALIIAAFADLRPIEQPLIRYRLHGAQQVGFQNKLQQRANTHWERLVESAKELGQLCDVLSAKDLGRGWDVLEEYRRHLEFLSFRSSLPAHRSQRVLPVLSRSLEYREHASGIPSIVKDLVLRRP